MPMASPTHLQPAKPRNMNSRVLRWLLLATVATAAAVALRYCTTTKPDVTFIPCDVLPCQTESGSTPAAAQPNYEKLNTLLAGHSLQSTIVIPLSTDLSYLQKKINEDLPVRLADINENKVCVKAAWLKTTVPYFDGLKLKSRQLKTKISPEINCNIKGYIDRRGPLAVSGTGNNLQLSLPIHAKVTAKAGIRETAVADATFTADTAISIGEDWQPRAVVDTDFHWDRRPELHLFNLVKITFGSKVEPRLRKKLAQFEDKIPKLLAKTNFKADAASAWNDIQQAQQISSHPPVYSHFRPDYVGYTGFTATSDKLSTQLIIKGQSTVTTHHVGQTELVPLPPLMHTNADHDRFRLIVPVVLEQSKLQQLLNDTLKTSTDIAIDKPGLKGTLSIDGMTIHLTDAGKVVVVASVAFDNHNAWSDAWRSSAGNTWLSNTWLGKIDLFNWFGFAGDVALLVEPELDSDNNVLSAGAIKLVSQTDSRAADTLVDLFNLPVVRNRLASIIRYDFSADIKRGIEAANEGLHSSDKELSLSGSVSEISIEQLFIVDGALAVVTKAEGQLQAHIGTPH